MGIPINPVSPRTQIVATSGQTVFNVPFPFFQNTDLAVYYTPTGQVANDAADILVYSTNYTVTGAGNANGGTVTLNVGAYNTGDIVTIVRDALEERLSLYLAGGLFTADQVNNDMSMQVMFSQQNFMLNSLLTPHYQYSAPIGPADLNLPQLGANEAWVMNSSATQIVATVVGSGGPTPPPIPGSWIGTPTSLNMTAGDSYFTLSPGGVLQLTLPTVCPAGTVFGIAGFSATGWKILQNAGQVIYFGNQVTTGGTGGSLASTNAKDNVTLLCVNANTAFVVLDGVGNITVV